MGVLGYEEVVLPLGYEGSEKLPVGRAEVLTLVHQHVVDERR